MTKADIGDQRQHTIESLGGTNGKGSTRMLKSMSNHAKNVSGELESDLKNLFILHGDDCLEKIGIDVVYMPNSAGYRYIVFARDDLSGWVEGRALASVSLKNVSKFIYEEIICRHDCRKCVVMDRRTENLDSTKDLLEKHRIRQTRIGLSPPV